MLLKALVRNNPFVFPLACIATVAILLVSESSHWGATDMLAELKDLGTKRVTLRQLQMGLLDAETGQRGYLLTGRKSYLQPYEQGVEDVASALQTLAKGLAAGDQAQTQLRELDKLSEIKLAELAATIKTFDEGHEDQAIASLLDDKGKSQMDTLHQLSASLMSSEVEKYDKVQVALLKTLQISRIGLATLCAISLLGLLLYLKQGLLLKLQQLDIKRRMQAERERLEAEVAQRTTQMTELSLHLQTAREDERGRLARNLHDELGALLTSAKLDAARIKSRLAGTAPEALERLAHLVETLNASIALGRSIIEDLRPSTLSNLGLEATLEILGREFAERSGIQVHCALAPVNLDANTELVVYRVVQEAITNVSKYAQASEVWLGLQSLDGRALVTVRDNGIGFQPSAKPASAYGLLGMRVRVQAEGGRMSVSSQPGQGSLIEVSLPESRFQAADSRHIDWGHSALPAPPSADAEHT